MQNRQKSVGLTIVELLIVIVVISILAAIAIVAFNGIQNRAQNASRTPVAQGAINVLVIYATLEDVATLLSEIPERQGVCFGKDNEDVGGNGLGGCS